MIRCCFILVFAFFTSQYSFSQYTITWATQQPAWVFPIWFENGDGQRDTIYFGYDYNADSTLGEPSDSIFGEKKIWVDTTKFNAKFGGSWYCGSGIICDSVLKADVNDTLMSGTSISFINGLLPLKVSWDVSLLRSTALPYPDQSPAPKAEGQMGFFTPMYSINKDSSWCSNVMQVLITDTVINNGGMTKCIRKDSIYFESMYGPGYAPSYISLTVRKWQGFIGNIGSAGMNQSYLLAYPIPFNNDLNINCVSCGTYHYRLTDVFGKIYVADSNLNGGIRISADNLPAGIYFLCVKYGEKTISKKLIKI